MRVDLREVLFIATAVAAAAQPVAVALAATVSGYVSSQTCGYLMAMSYCNFFQDSCAMTCGACFPPCVDLPAIELTDGQAACQTAFDAAQLLCDPLESKKKKTCKNEAVATGFACRSALTCPPVGTKS